MRQIVEYAKEFYKDEINDFVTYSYLSEKAKDPELKKILKEIAEIEKSHAQFWKDFLQKRGEKIPETAHSKIRLFLLSVLSKIINPVFVVSFLELGESGAVKKYYDFLKKESIDEEEKEKIKKIIVDELEHETTFSKETQKLGVSNIRDFVLGMNDGLVEILGVVTGLSAVYLNNPFMVAISGLIVGIAGALSMGIGAFISVRSQRQVNEGIKEKLEIIFDIRPEKAVDEFKEKLVETGIPEKLAEEISSKLGKEKNSLKKLLVEEVTENEIVSGLFTGFAYLIGVLFPVLPYFFSPTSITALPFAVLFAGLALTVVATVISVLSGINVKKKILEMVLTAFLAAGLSYGFGSLMQSIFGINID
ncbi:MAG TPA: rubrerythrin family protein [Persephonella sp.]|uniref:Putative rubrerythrin subfamily n=1 Tax=Persephonella marina (strain DSM 14350 / EX-H1) TaxID=123214 RepID=C0QR24_PERMH|nr:MULTISPECIES: VIT1/CCC1 transporter family protein [Persephonella]ACO03977.1 putative rubrerythrin subfamily [Persephonella marina EX-H1]HCB68870.1 rubrerythrin family protein [Persephonella sp.]